MKRDKNYQSKGEVKEVYVVMHAAQSGAWRPANCDHAFETSYDVCRFFFLFDFHHFDGKKGVGRGNGVGIELFRKVYLITTFCHSFDKRRRRLGHETRGEVRLKSGARDVVPGPLSHDDETSPRTCLGQWGLSGI